MTSAPIVLALPRVLTSLVGFDQVVGEGATLGALLSAVMEKYPALRPHFYDDAGAIRRHIRFIKNDEFWRADPLTMPLTPGDRVTVINSVSGG